MRDEAKQASLYLITNSKSAAGERGSFHPSTPLLRHHPRSLSSIAPRCHPPSLQAKTPPIFRAIIDRRFDDEPRTIVSNCALSTASNLFFPSPPLRNFFLSDPRSFVGTLHEDKFLLFFRGKKRGDRDSPAKISPLPTRTRRDKFSTPPSSLPSSPRLSSRSILPLIIPSRRH